MTEFARDPLNGTPGDDLASNSPWVRQPGISGALIFAPDGASACTTATTNTAAYYRSDAAPPTPDYFVSADIEMLDSLINASAVGVIGRASPSAITHYQARFLASSVAPNGTWQLRRIVNNVASTLASVAGSYVAGQKINVKMGMAGNAVSLYLDSSPEPLLGPVNGSTIVAAGFPGLLGSNVTGTRVRIDNFVADDGQVASGADGAAGVTGVASGAQVGIAAASGAAATAVTGVAAAVATNSSVGHGSAVAAAPAVSASALVGAASAVGAVAAMAEPSGVAAVAQVGVAAAAGGSASVASPAGVVAVASTTQPAASGAAAAAPAGVASGAGVGQPSAAAGTAVPATAVLEIGIGAVASVASVGAVTGAGSATCAPAGIAAATSVRDAIATGTISIPATAAPPGVSAYAFIGTATAVGGGLFARAPAGNGYVPRRQECQARPAQLSTGSRPASTQKAYR